MSHEIENILMGLCQAMVRNYLNNVGKGKQIRQPILFQGGVSENKGIRKAFEKALRHKIIVPEYNKVMGAFGIALLAKRSGKVNFKGLDISTKDVKVTGFECKHCPNMCEIVEARIDGELISRWNDRCGRWQKF